MPLRLRPNKGAIKEDIDPKLAILADILEEENNRGVFPQTSSRGGAFLSLISVPFSFPQRTRRLFLEAAADPIAAEAQALHEEEIGVAAEIAVTTRVQAIAETVMEVGVEIAGEIVIAEAGGEAEVEIAGGIVIIHISVTETSALWNVQ